MKTKINALITAAILGAFMATTAGATAAEPTNSQGVININTATSAELAYLPGIGPSKAEAIVQYRKNRPFKQVEHIMRVKGIGRKSFKKMQPYLSVDGPTTVKKQIPVTK